MNRKQPNPYQRLMREAFGWAQNIVYRKRKTLWMYPIDRLRDGWPLDGLYHRVLAAEQLGYDVQLEATDDGLMVKYVEKAPPMPYGWHD